jgi:hypothetical protein
MPDITPQFEGSDTQGVTSHFNGSVGVGLTAIPAVAGSPISDVLVENMDTTPAANRLMISFDGGVTFKRLRRGNAFAWTVRNKQPQVHIKSESGTVDYEMIINFELP